MKQFINLHTNSEYTFLESTIRIEELVELAVEKKQKFLAITERNSMFSMALFIKLCIKNNINPIIGVDLDVEDYRFILLPKNKEAFKYLSELSLKKSKNQKIEINEIDKDFFYILDHPSDGFKAKTGFLPNLKNLDNYFYNSLDENDSHAIVLFENITLKVSDQKLLQNIRKIKGINDNKNAKNFEFKCEYPDQIIERTKKIAKKCVYEKEDVSFELPKFVNSLNMSSSEYLRYITSQELKKKKNEFSNYSQAVSRLEHELNVIEKLNFSDYFLIIHDLVNYSKNRPDKIEIGPGRGSAAGSIVSFLCGITEINPLKYGLIFERFLNEQRATMPDIDIDIQDTKRNDVLNYLYNKYGHDKFSLITTYQTFGLKSALRDIARNEDIPVPEVNAILAQLPAEVNANEINKYTQFNIAIKNSKYVLKWEIVKEIAVQLADRPRQISTHAAGIILNDKPLIEKTPLWVNQDNQYPQTQISMDYLEEYGLIKIDLLGLKNLTIIAEIEKTLQAMGIKEEFNPDWNLQNTYAMLNKGWTLGIFQLESVGMTKCLKKVGVNTFSDLYDIISLFRPGPMENIPKYIKFKNKQDQLKTLNPIYDSILNETHGVIIYQEQIMEICQKIAGMSLSEADILRRAMSKKKHELLEEVREKFISGAIKNGYESRMANDIFAQISHFADYGFNKSHAVSYAFIALKMAYYKSKYPALFYGSLINSFLSSQDKVRLQIKEAKQNNLIIELPSIENTTTSVMWKNNKLFLPLTFAKGIGVSAVNKLKPVFSNPKYMSSGPWFLAGCLNENVGNSNIQKLIESNSLRIFGNVQTLLNAFNSVSELKKSSEIFQKGIDEFLDNDEYTANHIIWKKVEEDDEAFRKFQKKYFGDVISDDLRIRNFKYQNKTGVEQMSYDVAYRMIIQIIKVNKRRTKTGISLENIEFFDGYKDGKFWVSENTLMSGKFIVGKYYEVEIIKTINNNYKVTKILNKLGE
ncbi:DNA polymerase III subunit alpha [Mycoplasma sp. M5725]|uniref:DNA polymerase III subunit alpha n=3 Tax=Mycoplasma phocimorsus TaxID=3045839 RepID=A0AAJ1PSX7_9MOLU|nr:DNA polymerase III subunit alpha [Mycoplasma phocimorsus]MDJ1645924.1 DNA polymerase III subunit alpha [Mycoplasma phocimorsus]